MKKLILLIVILLIGAPTFAQELNEGVYLKDGTIIKGTIIELIPKQYVKVKEPSGNIIKQPMESVDKVAKENRYIYVRDTQITKGLAKRERGTVILKNTIIEKPTYKGFIDFGYTIRTGNYGRDRIEFSTTHGVQINSYLFLGIGSGVVLYHTDKDLISIPIYAAARAILPYGKVMPYVDFKIGGTVNEVTGFYMSPTIGCRFPINNNSKRALYAGIGYSVQRAEYELYKPIPKEWFTARKNCGGFNIKLGFDF